MYQTKREIRYCPYIHIAFSIFFKTQIELVDKQQEKKRLINLNCFQKSQANTLYDYDMYIISIITFLRTIEKGNTTDVLIRIIHS